MHTVTSAACQTIFEGLNGKKSKSREANAQLKARAPRAFMRGLITEMAVFTLEADYSGETGYPFDNPRQIGNKS